MKYLLPIDGLREIMLKPLLVQILGDVGKIFGHSEQVFLKIRDEEPLNMVRSPNRAIEDNRSFKQVSTGEKLYKYFHATSVTMNALNDEIFDQRLSRNNSYPIIQDGTFSISPTYRKTEFKMNVKYYNDDKINLEKRIDQVLLNLHTTQGKYVHDVDVRYPLGARLSYLLLEVFSKRMLIEPEDSKVEFKRYLDLVSSRRVKPFVNETMKGKNQFSIGIREKQRSIVGMLETNLDTVEIEDDENGYFIEFEYSFTIHHPFGFIVDQPIIINNSLLDSKFTKLIKQQPKPDHTIGSYFYTNINNAVPGMSQIQIASTPCYKIPVIDQDVGFNVNGRYHRILTRLVLVKNNNIRLNLHNISGKQYDQFELKEEILNFILNTEREYVTKYGRSIFYFGLWEDDSIEFKETLRLNENGVLENIEPCDIRKTYRISMFINMDFSYMDVSDKRRIARALKNNEVEINSNTEAHKETLELMYKTSVGLYSPYEMRKKYLSTLNLLLLSYNISPEEIAKIMKIGYNREDVVFAIINSKGGHRLAVQIYHTDVIMDFKKNKEIKK